MVKIFSASMSGEQRVAEPAVERVSSLARPALGNHWTQVVSSGNKMASSAAIQQIKLVTTTDLAFHIKTI